MDKNATIARELVRLARMIVAGENRPVLTLVIGLPGSGKSTFAKSIPNASHYEADMFFEDENGNYNFDRTRLKDAHKWCQMLVDNDLSQGRNVVVSNTGLSRWERETYYKMAQKHDAIIKVKTMTGSYGNIHGVPEEALKMMENRFQLVSQSEIQEYDIEII